MYRILIAGPPGEYPGCPIDVNSDTTNLFASEQAICFSSVDPADLADCDGVIVPGGLPDVGPDYWGEENIACSVLDHEMDVMQFRMIDEAVKRHKPMIGFCRGHQLVCAYFGATLIQHLETSDVHRYEVGHPKFHVIYNVPGSRFHEMYGSTMIGNSGHHQALKHIPDCLRVTQLWCSDEERAQEYVCRALADELHEGTDDCVIEAVEHKNYPFVGIQWHPELGGELTCKHLDLAKVPQYFYDMMEEERERIRKENEKIGEVPT